MQPIPPTVQARFIAHLKQRTVPRSKYSLYLKWLRGYLDFCEKYLFPPAQGSSLAHFLHKLREKEQPPGQQPQARHAISLYYELLLPTTHDSPVRSPQERLITGNPGSVRAPPADSTLNR
jgi:hypothetical protein